MEKNAMSYWRFAAMIATSVTVMYGLMYFHSYDSSHLRWSETLSYMTLITGAAMAVIMLGYLLDMYTRRSVDIGIFASSILTFAIAPWLVRSQETIQDRSLISATIPHHSIAILTSERAEIDDVRVRKLADEVIAAQRREIREMERLLDDIRKNGPVWSAAEARTRKVPEFSGDTGGASL